MGDVINLKETYSDHIYKRLNTEETKEKIDKAENVLIAIQWRDEENTIMHDLIWGTKDMKDMVYLLTYCLHRIFNITEEE
jgi:hypothetical protein